MSNTEFQENTHLLLGNLLGILLFASYWNFYGNRIVIFIMIGSSSQDTEQNASAKPPP